MEKKIPLEEIHFGELLGKGAFGAVYKGTWKTKTVAIKRVWNMADYDTDRYFAREVEILSSINHPYIVNFLGTSLDGKDLCLVTEYIKGPNLRDYLIQTNPDWTERTKFAIQIALSLQYLHKTRIIHRDVKTENVLVEVDSKTCKLCDFGFSRSSTSDTKRMTFVGSEWFEAPEIMFCMDYDERIDIFSYGMVLCEILSRQAPGLGVFKRVVPGFGLDPAEIQSRAESGAPQPLIHVAIACCEDDPNKRPELSHILETMRALYLSLANKPFTEPKTSSPIPRKSIKIPGKNRQKLTDSKPLPNEKLSTTIEGENAISKLQIGTLDPRIEKVEAELSPNSIMMTPPVSPFPKSSPMGPPKPTSTPTSSTPPTPSSLSSSSSSSSTLKAPSVTQPSSTFLSPAAPSPASKTPMASHGLLPLPNPNSIHPFELVKFSTPTFCHECKYFIWGLTRQGYHCKTCGINVHKKCLNSSLPCTPSGKK